MIEPIDLGIPGLTNIERIGAGGNAIVYRARQADLDRDVVVKVLLNIDAETTRRRFDRERRAMGRLSHSSGIAPLYGSGFTPAGQPYLLMPFYAQGSLQDHLTRAGSLDPETVRQLGITVANAVQTAHDNGVLHRDLKPANILMKRSGAPDVADFGIAHLVDDALGASQALTMTPLYTAPEAFEGVKPDSASDVYSVGATLYALLNGHPAHSDPNGNVPILALMRRINEEPLPPLPASVPKELAAVVVKAMSKNPADRPSSAGELARELGNVDMSISAATNKRSPLLIAAVVALIVAVVGGAVIAALMLDGSDTASDAPVATSTVAPEIVSTPTVLAVTPSAVPSPVGGLFDTVAAADAAKQVLVRVEAYSCSGVELATGVLLGDGAVVTTEQVLLSPWRIDVTIDGQTFQAEPETADTSIGLSTITIIDDTESLEALRPGTFSVGEQVGFVGIDGRTAIVTIASAAENGDHATGEIFDASAGNAVEPADAIVNANGELLGIASVGGGIVRVVTLDQLKTVDSLISPDWSCASDLRDLGPGDTEAVVSPAIAELLTMQQLSDAYAGEQWADVRRLEPAKGPLTDQQFVNGWRPLRRGFVYPVERMVEANGDARWRIGLIGHETWNGTDLTTLFCLTWTVDAVSGAVRQSSDDAIAVYGPRPGQEQRAGFVDPAGLRGLIDTNCPY